MPVVEATRWDINWSQIWDEVAEQIPDAPALLSAEGVATSFAQLEDRASRLAEALRCLGGGRDDTIGLFMYNRPEYLEAIYAAFKLSAIPVNMNFRYKPAELVELLDVSKSGIIVAPSSLRGTIAEAFARMDRPPLLIEVDDSDLQGPAPVDPIPGALELESLIGDRLSEPVERHGTDFIYIFTGGTTGTPKVVMWTHGNLLDAQRVPLYGTGAGPLPESIAEMVAVAVDASKPKPRLLPISPLMHSSAMFNAMNTLALGGAVVLLDNPSFDPAQVLGAVDRLGVTRIVIAGNAVATPLVDELRRARDSGAPHDVSTVDQFISSGMAWTDASKAELLEFTSGALLFDIFGSTEGGPFAYAFVRSPEDLPSTIILANEAAVLAEDGGEIDPEAVGETGILAYYGPKPVGYLDAPQKTAETYRHLGERIYVAPGDYVRLLGGGRIEFLGRGSSSVNTGGEKVYPAEVEDALRTHPDVTDVVVFGVADRRWGQAVAAVVAVRDGADVSVETLRARVGELLAGYKKPKHIAIVESLERTPSGKADMRRMQSLIAELISVG